MTPATLPKMQLVSLWLVGIVLGIAAVITTAIGTLSAPRNMPDERHHYAVVKHIADHFGEFPLRYETIRTDFRGDPNHLVHPPLYHYLMAGFYKVLNPSRHFTEAGKRFDRHGSLQSSQAILPVLRGISRFWVYLGLVGVFFLVRDALRRELLTPLWAIACVVFLTGVPAFLYIGGGLNNDVLGLALWPWLALALLAFWFDHSPLAGLRAFTLLALLALTKASFWSICLVLAGMLVGKAMLNRKRVVHNFRAVMKTNPVKGWVGCVGAGVFGILALWHLGHQRVRFGSFQPDYEVVYNIPFSQSKFLVAPSIEQIRPLSPWYFSAICSKKLVQSFGGATSHLEILGDPFAAQHLLWSGVALLFLALGSLGFWRHPQTGPPLKFLILGMACLPVVNYLLLLQVNSAFYLRTGNFAMEGRYFVGHLHFAILAAFMVLSVLWKLGKEKAFSTGFTLAGLVVLGWIYLKPFSFFQQTHEIFFRAEMEKVIPGQLLREGYVPLELKALNPKLNQNASLKWQARLGKYFRIHTPNDRLGFRLPPGAKNWELQLFAEAPAPPSPLRWLRIQRELRSGEDDQPSETQGEAIRLGLAQHMEVMRFHLKALPESHPLWVIQPEPRLEEKPWFGLDFFKPNHGPIKVLGLYARPAD